MAAIEDAGMGLAHQSVTLGGNGGTEKRRRALRQLMRQSVSRAPSFCNQLSSDSGPLKPPLVKLPRPSSSPAATKRAPPAGAQKVSSFCKKTETVVLMA